MFSRRKLVPEIDVFHPQMIVVGFQLPVLFPYVKQDEVVLQEADRVAANTLRQHPPWASLR